MKVLYLVPLADAAERLTPYTFLDEEILALRDAGIQPVILSPYHTEKKTVSGIEYRSIPHGGSWKERVATIHFMSRVARLLPLRSCASEFSLCYHLVRLERTAAVVARQEGIDLIHSHFGTPGGFGGALARARSNTPLVATFRGADLELAPEIGYGARLSKFFDSSIRLPLVHADRISVFSDYMRRLAITLGAIPESVHVVRKGVDTLRFSPSTKPESVRRSLGLPDNPVVLTVCGLKKRKGLRYVLEAVAALSTAWQFTLVICGDGEELQALRDLSRRLGIERHVHFAGKVERDRIPEYFAACDIFVLGSLMEAAGNVLLEAMAAGRPIVCTDSGGPAEYVEDGRTALVVPVADPEAMASGIRRLLEDPSQRAAFGRRGRQRALEHFKYPRMIEDIVTLYEEVLSRRGNPSSHIS